MDRVLILLPSRYEQCSQFRGSKPLQPNQDNRRASRASEGKHLGKITDVEGVPSIIPE